MYEAEGLFMTVRQKTKDESPMNQSHTLPMHIEESDEWWGRNRAGYTRKNPKNFPTYNSITVSLKPLGMAKKWKQLSHGMLDF